MSALGHGAISLLFSPFFVAGLTCYGLSLICFTKGLNTVPISAAYPVQAGFAFIILIILSFLLLNEPIGAGKLMGLALILLGITAVMRY